MPVRKALRVRTAFNLLGPMLNPADAAYGLVGVYSTSISHLMADALRVGWVRRRIRSMLVLNVKLWMRAQPGQPEPAPILGCVCSGWG